MLESVFMPPFPLNGKENLIWAYSDGVRGPSLFVLLALVE